MHYERNVLEACLNTQRASLTAGRGLSYEEEGGEGESGSWLGHFHSGRPRPTVQVYIGTANKVTQLIPQVPRHRPPSLQD